MKSAILCHQYLRNTISRVRDIPGILGVRRCVGVFDDVCLHISWDESSSNETALREACASHLREMSISRYEVTWARIIEDGTIGLGSTGLSESTYCLDRVSGFRVFDSGW